MNSMGNNLTAATIDTMTQEAYERCILFTVCSIFRAQLTVQYQSYTNFDWYQCLRWAVQIQTERPNNNEEPRNCCLCYFVQTPARNRTYMVKVIQSTYIILHLCKIRDLVSGRVHRLIGLWICELSISVLGICMRLLPHEAGNVSDHDPQDQPKL